MPLHTSGACQGMRLIDLGSTCGQMVACTKASGDMAKRTERANSHGHLRQPTRGTLSRVEWKGWILSLDPMGTPTAVPGAPIRSMEGLIVVAMLVVGTRTSRFSK